MKTASMVLAITAGALAVIFALIIIISGTAFFDRSQEDDSDNSVWRWVPRTASEIGRNIGGTIFITLGALGAAGGIMGFIGGMIVRKKSTAAGVLMVVAAVFCLFEFFNFVSTILFILGAVFAFVKRKPKHAAVPYPQYPLYSPAPPQQPQDAPKE